MWSSKAWVIVLSWFFRLSISSESIMMTFRYSLELRSISSLRSSRDKGMSSSLCWSYPSKGLLGPCFWAEPRFLFLSKPKMLRRLPSFALEDFVWVASAAASLYSSSCRLVALWASCSSASARSSLALVSLRFVVAVSMFPCSSSSSRWDSSKCLRAELSSRSSPRDRSKLRCRDLFSARACRRRSVMSPTSSRALLEDY